MYVGGMQGCMCVVSDIPYIFLGWLLKNATAEIERSRLFIIWHNAVRIPGLIFFI